MTIDIILIIIASLISTLVAEGLSWLLVYRTESYQRLKATVDKLQGKVDKKEQEEEELKKKKKKPEGNANSNVSNRKKSSQSQNQDEEDTTKDKKDKKDKKLTRIEDQLKEANRDLSMSKMKSTFVVGFAMISLVGFLNSYFDGIVVARLPFEPIGFLQGLSHRNLPGNDYLDCSMIFIYVLCSIGIRGNLQKLLGIQQPQVPSFFGQPTK
eukprot:TRINITY_DN4885_c0_g1_i3.p1 TRINITY_DN4885_c0_g1~~TRINITY_DN4885_c0_g1_i3.p1  ORF type:complete len:211 (-),score=55.62 TRINITY_DN4885_c0_g1_i3:148-780(-)